MLSAAGFSQGVYLPYVILAENGADARTLGEVATGLAAVRAEALQGKFSFKMEIDEEAKKHMFPQNARLAAKA